MNHLSSAYTQQLLWNVQYRLSSREGDSESGIHEPPGEAYIDRPRCAFRALDAPPIAMAALSPPYFPCQVCGLNSADCLLWREIHRVATVQWN